MVKIRTSNALRWLRTQFSDTATDIKMNGTQSAGSSNNMARADHVHPTDTNRAPENHASPDNTYGVANTANYGHAMASTSIPEEIGVADRGSETDKFARGDHSHAHPAYTPCTGKPTADLTPDFGDDIVVSQIVSDGTGHVSSATDRTITLPDADATSNSKGLVMLVDTVEEDNMNAVTSNAVYDEIDAINTLIGEAIDFING